MNKFCLIGIGPHSKKKLIPSINKLPKTKYYIISKNIHKDLNYLRSFNSINKAIKTIHKDTKFIIASPPQLHFKHCYEISKNGYEPHFMLAEPDEEINISLAAFSLY